MHRLRTTRAIARRAYTLTELLIVITILGTAAAIVVPQFDGTDSMRAQAAIRNVIADLSFAQSDAVAHQEYRRVHFFADGSGYCLLRATDDDFTDPFDPDAADYVFDPLSAGSLGGRYVVRLSDDDRFDGVTVTEVSIDGGGRDVVYDPLGGTVQAGNVFGSGGYIELAAGANVYRVLVGPVTGKLSVVRIEEEEGGGEG